MKSNWSFMMVELISEQPKPKFGRYRYRNDLCWQTDTETNNFRSLKFIAF